MTLAHEFYVVQVGMAVFGYGSTDAEAVAMANEFGCVVSVNTIPRYVGTCATADRLGQKSMTQNGEMHSGEIVLVDRQTAEHMEIGDLSGAE